MVPRAFIIASSAAVVLFAATGFIAGSNLSPAAYKTVEGGRAWGIQSAQIEARIQKDGSAQVTQNLTVDFQGAFRGFFQDIPFNNQNKFMDLQAGDEQKAWPGGATTTLGVVDNPETWGKTYLEGNVLRVVWHHDTANQTKTFRLKYRITRIAENFQDVDVVRMRVWGQFWQAGVRYLNAQITLPTDKILSVSAGPQYLKPQTLVRENTILLQANKLPARQSLDLLVTLPAGSAPGAAKEKGSPPQLKESLGDRGYQAYGENRLLRSLAWALALLLIALLPISAWLLLWKKALKDAYTPQVEKQYSPPPGSLVYGYTLAQEDLASLSSALTATLIDLVARNFYAKENIKGEGGQWKLKISLPQTRPEEPLTAGEQATLQYFDELLSAGPCVVDDLSERVEKNEASQKRISEVNEKLLEDMQAAAPAQKSKVNAVKTPAGIWALVATPLAAALTFSLPSGHLLGTAFYLGVGVTILALMWAVISWPRGDFVYSDEQLMQQAGPWRDYRDFITSFSSMETAPDLQVILWERAFAAALLFGVAEEFSERAKVLVPELNTSPNLAVSSFAYSYDSFGSSISSAGSPSSSSSGVGGGFGGGGFGGGGGGAW